MNTYHKSHKIITTILLLNITGCSSISRNVFSRLSGFSCPPYPTDILLKENVKELDLEAETLTSSSQIKPNQSIGYLFEVKTGQKLNYKTNKNTCLWVYSPENDLLNSPENKTVSNLELTQSGTYIVQVYTLKSLPNLDLDLNLGLSKKQAINVLENWYGSKEKVLGKTFDNNVLNQYTTGNYKTQTNKTVATISKTKCYYKFNQTTIEEIVRFDNIPQRPIIVAKVHEDHERYSPVIGTKCPEYGFNKYEITYWFEKDNGVWKIYDSDLKILN